MIYPKISIVIPTFNEEKRIEKCLRSIFDQDYPKDKIEVLIADDRSTDNTVELCKKYPVKVISHNSKDPEAGKLIAFNRSSSELFTYLDADIQLRGKSWLKKMIIPLVQDDLIAASFTRYYSNKESSDIEKYLNLDPLQRDSIYQFFSPSLKQLEINKTKTYKILQYTIKKIPPSGLAIHRRNLIKPILRDQKRFLELDILVRLVQNGHNKFAYVPKAGLYHHHATGLIDLLKKRSRNVTKVYLNDNINRKYRWFDTKTPEGITKIVLWVIYANLFFPALVRGIFISIKNKTWIGVYDPFICLLATDIIIYSFLSQKEGRKVIGR